MTIENMKEQIISVYPGPKWKLAVQGMEPRQVVAIYKSFIRTGRFNKPKKKKNYTKLESEPYCEQMTIFDLLKNKGD